MLRFSMLVLAALIGTGPAYAYQTEVDQHEMQWRRQGRAEWNREVRRQERLERERLEAAAEESASSVISNPDNGSYPSGVLSAEQVAGYARAAGFPEDVVDEMVAISARESGFCPTAVYGYGCAGSGHAYSGGPACGLTQLFPCPGPEYLDPLTNMRGAYAKYQASGLAPWGM